MEFIFECVLDALMDSVKLLPFLFITYLIMEYVEHNMGEYSKDTIRKAGKFGPLLGGLVGGFPQCGFSAAASGLYAGRIITVGTLIAIYLSTSDEMLPIFISNHVAIPMMVKVILLKMGIGIFFGFLVDMAFRKHMHMRAYVERVDEKDAFHINQICEQDECKCQDGLLKSALKHTIHIFTFILIISVVLNVSIGLLGEDALSNFILNKKFIGVFLSAIIGLIPNCAASVTITTLYLSGFMSFGAMMAGLLVGAGVGLLVLFRVNEDLKDSLRIVAILYGCGVLTGLLLEIFAIF